MGVQLMTNDTLVLAEVQQITIHNLRKEELHYESEISRLESLLTDMEHAPSHIVRDTKDEDIDITEF